MKSREYYLERSDAHVAALDETYRKNNGIFYTDLDLAEDMIRFLGLSTSARILDPCCGTGSFLYVLREHDYNHLRGCDIDDAALQCVKDCAAVQHVYRISTMTDAPDNVLSVMKEQPFDAIVTNLPYAVINKSTSLFYDENFRDMVRCSGNNLFISGLYQSFDLVKKSGTIAVIIPKSFLHVDSYADLRKFILREKTIESITDLGIHFDKVRGEQAILVLKNEKAQPGHKIKLYKYNREMRDMVFITEIDQAYYQDRLTMFYSDTDVRIHKHMSQYKKLRDIVYGTISRGKVASGVTGRQIRKFGLKRVEYDLASVSRQVYVQNVYSAEAGFMATSSYGLRAAQTVTVLPFDDSLLAKYVLGLLHSNLLNFYASCFIYNHSRVTIHTDALYIGELPVLIDYEYLDDMIDLVTGLEQAEYLSEDWFDLLDRLNVLVYCIYDINDSDRAYIDATMAGIWSSKWTKRKAVKS